jgi:hypothetical protein
LARFEKGNQAAVGRRPKTTLLTKLRDAVSPEWPHIVETIIGMAKAGDMQAATLLANRLAPVPKSVGPVVELDIGPDLSPVQRMQAITAAALAGEVSPDQAKALADLITIEVQLIELTALEARIAALEGNRG